MYTEIYEGRHADDITAVVRYDGGKIARVIPFKKSWRGLGWFMTEMRVNFQNIPTCTDGDADLYELIATNNPRTLEQHNLSSEDAFLWVEDMSVAARERFGLVVWTNIYG